MVPVDPQVCHDTGSVEFLLVEVSSSCGVLGTVLELLLVVEVGNRSLRGRVADGNKHWRSWSVQLLSLPAFLNEKPCEGGVRG